MRSGAGRLPKIAWATCLGDSPNAMPGSATKTLLAETTTQWKLDVKFGAVCNNSPDLLDPLP